MNNIKKEGRGSRDIRTEAGKINFWWWRGDMLDKCLKDRKDRGLSPEDVRLYCKTVTALSTTIKVQ